MIRNNTKKTLYISYDTYGDNFGDILNPILASNFTNKNVKKIGKRKSKFKEHYFMIGSIIQRCNSQTIIWGSGLISDTIDLKRHPKKVLAVRGPLTRKRLLELGVSCPKIYGDPALLLPKFYDPKNINKKYELGIIPHYVDKNDDRLKKFSNTKKIKIIDVQNKNPLEVVNQVIECKKIISSSLHGIIVADAYGIPSAWTELSNKVIGNGFKFNDYFLSVGRKQRKAFNFNQFESLDDILNVFTEEYVIDIDLKKLLEVFPK